MAIIVSLLIAFVGAIIYLIASNPKFAELGRLAWLAGLIAFAIEIGTHTISFLK